MLASRMMEYCLGCEAQLVSLYCVVSIGMMVATILVVSVMVGQSLWGAKE